MTRSGGERPRERGRGRGRERERGGEGECGGREEAREGRRKARKGKKSKGKGLEESIPLLTVAVRICLLQLELKTLLGSGFLVPANVGTKRDK